MTDLKKFLKALREDDKLMDGLDRAFRKAGVSYEQSVIDQLDSILTKMLTDADGFIRPSPENLNFLDDIDRRMISILEGEGLEGFTTQFQRIMAERLSTLDRLVKNGGIEKAAGIDFQNLDFFDEKLRNTLRDIGEASGYAASQLRDEILAYKIDIDAGAGVRFSDLRQSLITKAGILPRYAGTVSNTTLFSLDRAARIMQARKAGIQKMKYVGVVDSLTRPFCLNHIGMVETIEFWEQLQNDVNPQPVAEYCGGWNCRHRLIMWSDAFEVESNPSHPPKPEQPQQTTPPPAIPKKKKKPDPEPEPEPDPAQPPVVPNNVIERVDAEFPVSFMKEAGVLLDKPVTTKFKRHGKSYYQPSGDFIQLGTKTKFDGKASMRTAVHEYGHAIHNRSRIVFGGSRWAGTRTPATQKWYNEVEPKIRNAFEQWLTDNKLRSKLRTKKGSGQFLWDTLDEIYGFIKNTTAETYREAFEQKHGIAFANDTAAQFADIWDMLQGVTRGKYGTGHEIAYQRAKGEVEVWAHLWEMRHLDYSEVLKTDKLGLSKLMKELQEISKEYFDELINEKKRR